MAAGDPLQRVNVAQTARAALLAGTDVQGETVQHTVVLLVGGDIVEIDHGLLVSAARKRTRIFPQHAATGYRARPGAHECRARRVSGARLPTAAPRQTIV